MHVQSIRLKYFKKFRDRVFDFTDPKPDLRVPWWFSSAKTAAASRRFSRGLPRRS